jgi:hypothetical protein
LADARFSDFWEAGRTLAEEAKQNAIESGLLGGRDGRAGAFHHCFWSCRMTQEMGAEMAAQVGDLHEECAQSGRAPEQIDMDLMNDKVGRNLVTGSDIDCLASCKTALANSQLKWLQEEHDSYNIVVVGGCTGGAAAAIEAVRNGHSVVLLEETDRLGGQMSAAGVTSMDDYSNQESGFYAEFLKAMEDYYGKENISMRTCYNVRRKSGANNYCCEPDVARCILTKLVKKENVKIFSRTIIVWVEGHTQVSEKMA